MGHRRGGRCSSALEEAHRELPKKLLGNRKPLTTETFTDLIKSSYAKKQDLNISSYRRTVVKKFQQNYLKIMKEVSKQFHRNDLDRTLREVIMRASVMNRDDRITGDSILHLTSSLIRNHSRLSHEQKHEVFKCFVEHQSTDSELKVEPDSKTGKIVLRNLKAIRDYSEGF